jgi:DNA-binding response OmpR family regulator
MRRELSDAEMDLCILDIGLPDTDGFALLQEIRNTSDLPVIFLTVRDQVDDRVSGLENGADDYISKPIEPRELSAGVRTVLRRKAGRSANRRDRNAKSAAGQDRRLDSQPGSKDGFQCKLPGRCQPDRHGVRPVARSCRDPPGYQ